MMKMAELWHCGINKIIKINGTLTDAVSDITCLSRWKLLKDLSSILFFMLCIQRNPEKKERKTKVRASLMAINCSSTSEIFHIHLGKHQSEAMHLVLSWGNSERASSCDKSRKWLLQDAAEAKSGGSWWRSNCGHVMTAAKRKSVDAVG